MIIELKCISMQLYERCESLLECETYGVELIAEWRGMSIEVREGLILKYKEYVCDVFILVLPI